MLLLSRSATWPGEEFADCRGVVERQFAHRADALHLAVGEDGDAIRDLPQQVEIVRDDDDAQAEQVTQFEDQLIDAVFKLRSDIQHYPLLGDMKRKQEREEAAALVATPTHEMKGLMR